MLFVHLYSWYVERCFAEPVLEPGLNYPEMQLPLMHSLLLKLPMEHLEAVLKVV